MTLVLFYIEVIQVFYEFTYPMFASMDVLFKRKDVSGYPWFGSRDVQGSEGEDIPVNSKYPLPSK